MPRCGRPARSAISMTPITTSLIEELGHASESVQREVLAFLRHLRARGAGNDGSEDVHARAEIGIDNLELEGAANVFPRGRLVARIRRRADYFRGSTHDARWPWLHGFECRRPRDAAHDDHGASHDNQGAPACCRGPSVESGAQGGDGTGEGRTDEPVSGMVQFRTVNDVGATGFEPATSTSRT